MHPTADNDNSIAADVLKGADAIADFLGMDQRAIYYAISKKQLPTFRMGAGVFARKSTLLGWIAAQERAAQA